jgi:hypothetical protein
MKTPERTAHPLVIVIGRGHSGTRAISRTLQESGVFMGDELNESYDLVPATPMYDACRVIARHVRHLGGVTWDFSRLHSMPLDPEFERLVHEYLASVLTHAEGARGWKLPETTLAFPWIVRLFPDAHYISWVRDPRDSIIGGHLTDDLRDFGVRIDAVDDVRTMRAISWKYQREIVAATPKPARWIEVRFEDFVLDQERTLARLERFLDRPLARIEVRRESVGRYRTDAELHDFDYFAEDLRTLGYEDAC